MIRMVPGLMFITLAALLFVALVMQPAKNDSFSGALTDQMLPPLSVITATQEEAALPKGKVMVINFLASWCGPCAVEMGELVAMKNALPGVTFVGIAWNDSPSNIAPWLKKYGNPFDDVFYDPKGRAAIAMGMRGVPETFIIDADGVVRYQLAGAMNDGMRAKLTPLVQSLLEEK